jgi:hypothetical protein
MARVNIVDINKEQYYEQFLWNFDALPNLVKNACGNALLLPLLFKQIQHDYEFVQDSGDIYEYKLISNENVIAQMNTMGLTRLSLPELRLYKNDYSDYMLSTNWMGGLVGIDLPNLEASSDGFLRYAFNLEWVSAPKWCVAGKYTLFSRRGSMSVLNAPKLRKVGLHSNPIVYETVKRNTRKQK